MKIKYPVQVLTTLLSLLTFSKLDAQLIWAENFSYPNGTTTGANNNTANPALDWTSICPTCVAGDWYEVRNNLLEGLDTNGPASMETESIDISAYPAGVEVLIDLTEVGDMEDCPGGISSGCNSVDWIRVEYKLNNNPYVDVGSPAGGLCTGACAGDTYFAIGNFNSTSVDICPLVGDSLRLRVSVQCWASNEFLRVDNILVQGQTCNPSLTLDSLVHVTCNGGSDGQIWVQPFGGASPFTYSLNGGPFQASNQFTGLGAGTYNVVVQDNNGTQATLSGIVITESSPILFSDSTLSVSCNGGSDGVIFALSVSGGIPPYTFALDAPPFQSSNAFPNLSAGSYTLIVQDSAGCQDSLPVSVNEPSPIALSMSALPSGCTTATGSVSVNASGGTAGYTYLWSSVPSQSTPTATGLAVGNYTVTVTDTNGCSGTASVNVPQASFPIAEAGLPDSLCIGQGSAQLNGSGTSGAAPFTYAWTCSGLGPCNLDSLNDNDPVATPTASTTYYLQVTDADGCVSPLDSLLITVLSLPLADAGLDGSFCPGQPFALSGNASGNGPYNYAWSCDAQTFPCPLDSLSDDDPTASPIADATFYLQVMDANGCMSLLDSVAATLLPTPLADAGIGDTICPGDTVQFGGAGSGSTGPYSYLWTPAQSLSNPVIADPRAFPLQSAWFYLTVTAQGCPSLSDSVWVEVQYAPTALAGADTVVCLGDTVTLIAGVNGSAASHTFYWYGPTGLLNPNGEDTLQLNPTLTTDYTLVAAPPAGCVSLPDTVHVTVEQPFVHDRPASLEFCPGEPLQIGVPSALGFLYAWSPVTDLDYAFESETWLIATESRNYTLTVTDTSKRSQNCRTQEYAVSLSAGDCLMPNVLTPNGDGINDVLDLGPYYHGAQLSIFDRWGQQVYHSDRYPNDWNGTNQAGKALPEGVYYYSIRARILPSNSQAYDPAEYQKAHVITVLR